MTALVYPYLGVPGAMVQLPGPNGAMDAPLTRGDQVTTLLSGGVGVVRRLNPKRTYSLPYVSRPGTGLADTLLAFYRGLYTDGPFVYVDPSVSNVLSMDTSTCGLRSNASHGWVSSAGTLTVDTSTAAPAGVLTGVLKWASGTSSATLQPGVTANTAVTTKAPVYLPTEPVSVSVWVKASAAATLTLRAAGHDAGGSTLATVQQSISVTTSWQRFQLSAGAGNSTLAGSVFVLPRLVMPSSSPPASVWIAGAQLEYADSASTFQPGMGSPRVLISATPGRGLDKFDGYSNHTLTLAEV
jgi:hypothetical protein